VLKAFNGQGTQIGHMKAGAPRLKII